MNRDLDFASAEAVGPQAAGAPARLVEYAPGRWIALPVHTTIELLEHPRPAIVPGAAGYAWGLLGWQGQRIPMIDLEALCRAQPHDERAAAPRYALVVAFQRGPRQAVEHGAIGLSEMPQTVTVRDAAACGLPQDSPLWPRVALACFRHGEQAVPVVDTGRLFGRAHG